MDSFILMLIRGLKPLNHTLSCFDLFSRFLIVSILDPIYDNLKEIDVLLAMWNIYPIQNVISFCMDNWIWLNIDWSYCDNALFSHFVEGLYLFWIIIIINIDLYLMFSKYLINNDNGI